MEYFKTSKPAKWVIFCIALMMALTLSGCGSDNAPKPSSTSSSVSSSSSNKEASASDADAMKNISIESQIATNGDLAVFVTNNNDFEIDELGLDVALLDSSGNTVDLVSDGHDVILPGSTVVSTFFPEESYSSVDVSFTVSVDKYPGYVNHSENARVETETTDSAAIVKVTNEGDVDIDEVEIVALFYKGDEMVGASWEQDIYDLAAGASKSEKLEPGGFEREDFDRADVYLNQAHTFG